MATLSINGQQHVFDVDPAMPVLWALRDLAGLTGTKFGCGVAACGACTVHVDGKAVRSCVMPVSAAEGRQITTIEAIGQDPVGARVQAAWIANDVPQCGYCQSGQVMSAVALLRVKPFPSDDDIDRAMAGNLCRCAAYQRIRAAVKAAGEVA